jgi:hypothetical protein
MKAFSERVSVIFLAALLLGGADSLAAEKKKLTWYHTGRTTISEAKMKPDMGNELVQGVYSDPIKSESADFDMIEARPHNQDENFSDGRGRHRGTEVNYFKNGDTTVNNYEGTHRLTTKPDGYWEVNYEGRFTFVGGTGRFQNIKGGGVYKGKITPEGLHETDNAEISW